MERAQEYINLTTQFMATHELILQDFTRLFPYISMPEGV